MDTSITNPNTNNIKSIIRDIKNSDTLPFVSVLSKDDIIANLPNQTYRERTYTPDLTIFTFLSQVMNADQSCQAAVAQVICNLVEQGKEPPSANTAAYCKARAKLPESLLSELTKNSAQELEDNVLAEWLWRNRHVKLIDGSTISMPDTPENQAVYPQPDSQKKILVFLLCELLQQSHWQQARCLILQWVLIQEKRLVNMHYYVKY